MSGLESPSSQGANTLIPTVPDMMLMLSHSLKPLRNKFGTCSVCRALPPPGQKFSQCSGCKAVLYCSKECQVAGWSDHKHYQSMQKLEEAKRDKPPPAYSSFPFGLSFTERMTLLTDFMTIHDKIINMAAYSAIVTAERERGRSIDFSLEGVSIRLQYRSDNNGNPARAFSLRSVRILDMVRPSGGAELALDAESLRQQEQEWREIYGDRYLGRFLLKFAADEVKVCTERPHVRPTMEFVGLHSTSSDWVRVLSTTMDAGVVWQSLGPIEGSVLVPGEMQRVGKSWQWTMFPRHGGVWFPPPIGGVHDAQNGHGGPGSTTSASLEGFLERMRFRQALRDSRRKLKERADR